MRGSPNGFVYQKAYLEFFAAPETVELLMEVIKSHKSMMYHVINASGSYERSNHLGVPTAVTWGVFPGKEIVQPTVVDPMSFKVWKVRERTEERTTQDINEVGEGMRVRA